MVSTSDDSRSYRVRRARAGDVALLQAIERDAARSYGALAETRFCVDLPTRGDDEHRTAREQGVALVAELAGVPIGFILVVPKDGGAHILEIAVAQARQGRGCGRRLIALAEAWAAETGFGEMTLTTFREVAWNAPFYAKIGYRVFEVDPDRPELTQLIAHEIELGIHDAPRVAMRKTLSEHRNDPRSRSLE
jgi:GNAT superfamily N-acetyltransferase